MVPYLCSLTIDERGSKMGFYLLTFLFLKRFGLFFFKDPEEQVNLNIALLPHHVIIIHNGCKLGFCSYLDE